MHDPTTTESEDHVPPPAGRTYVLALVALLVLTAVSWAVIHLELGRAATPIALAIAGTKAGVVAIAFMEIKRASLVARIVAMLTVTFIALLCAGVIGDIAFR